MKAVSALKNPDKKLKLVRELVRKNVDNPTICCTTAHYKLDYLDMRR